MASWISQTAFLVSRVLQKRIFTDKSSCYFSLNIHVLSSWIITLNLTFLQDPCAYSMQEAEVGLITSENTTGGSDYNMWTILVLVFFFFSQKLYICYSFCTSVFLCLCCHFPQDFCWNFKLCSGRLRHLHYIPGVSGLQHRKYYEIRVSICYWL